MCVCVCRRGGDADPNRAIVADTMKLLGNSGYGKTITDQGRHRDVKYVGERDAAKLVNDKRFRALNELDPTTYEVEMAKGTIAFNLPLQIGFFVYQYAKLRMLEFYYACIDKYVDRSDYEYCEMDTDSAYFAIAGPTLASVIKPHLKESFYRDWCNWFPAEACDVHHEVWIATRISDRVWEPQPCCIARQKFDKRTPGLFKEEWCGDGIISLCSKTYFCFGATNKKSSKGLNRKQNELDKESYLNVLRSKKAGSGANRGFQSKNNAMYTYTQVRAGLSYFLPQT